MIGILFCILILLLYTFPCDTFAASGILRQLSFHGSLKTDAGVVVTDGSYDIVFKIYNAPSGGTLLWTGTHTSANGNAVSVASGFFSVLLGSGTGNTLSLDFNDDTYWLGITVGTDSEMTPRTRIGAAAYAFNADKVDGYDATDLLRDNATATIATSSTSAILTLNQEGAGDVFNAEVGGNPVFTITNQGGTVIGTTTTNALFEIYDESNVGALLKITEADPGDLGYSAAIQFRNEGSGGGTWNLVAGNTATGDIGGKFGINDGNMYRLVIDTNGNVGIGSTSPMARLSVGGDTYLGGTLTATGTVTFTGLTNGLLYANNSGVVSASTTLGAAILDSSIILSTEIDTLSEIETLAGAINILQSTEVDTSSELAGLITDETGSGSLVLSASPTLTGVATLANASTSVLSVSGNTYFPSGIWNTSGNVGIGTTTPTGYKLSIHADGKTITQLQIANASTSGWSEIDFTNSTGAAYVYLNGPSETAGGSVNSFNVANTIGSLNLWTNGVSRLNIDTAGNVGIGTTTPGELLDLYSTTDADLQLTTAATGDYSKILGRRARTGDTIVQSGDTLFEFEGRGYDGTAYRQGALITLAVDATPGTSDMPGNIQFATTPDGSSSVAERMRITSSGNVGIGTTSPMSKLSVAGDTYMGGNLTATGTVTFIGTTTLASLLATGSSTIGGGGTQNGLTVSGNATTTGSAYFAGNVGVGTTTPYGALSIQSSVGGSNDSSERPMLALRAVDNVASGADHTEWLGFYDDVGQMRFGVETWQSGGNHRVNLSAFQANGSAGFFGLQSDSVYITNGGGYGRINLGQSAEGYLVGGTDLVLQSNQGGFEGLRVSGTTGNVGIGTTSPAATLSVVGNNGIFGTQAFFTTGAGASGVAIGGNSSIGNIQGQTTATGTAVDISINANGGDVGIGTTTPGSKLTIAVNGSAQSAIEFQDMQASGRNWRMGPGSGTGSASQFNIFDGTAGATRFTIDSSGSVGIGIVTPSTEGAMSKLSIVGAAAQTATTLAESNTKAAVVIRPNSNSGYAINMGSVSNDFPYIQGAVFSGGSAAASLLLNPFGGNVGIGTTSPVSKFSVVEGSDTWAATFYGLNTSNTVRIGTLSGVATIGANNNAGTLWADLSINPGGNTYFGVAGGNVGIGTTTPAAKLHIMDTVSSLSTGIKITPYHTVGVVAGTQLQAIDADGSTMRVISLNSSGGNVGVGTTTPNAKLAISGTGLLQAWNTTFTEAGRRNWGVATEQTTTGDWQLQVSSAMGGTPSTAVLTANSSGYVGIGTTTPDRKLVIDSGGASTDVYMGLGNNGTRWLLGSEVAPATDRFAIYDVDNTAYRMVVDDNGNVGIGTTTPTAQLSTTGSVRFSNFGAGTLQTDANGNVSVSSDERLKDIEGEFTRGLEAILTLDPINFTWKEETGFDTANVYTGFSAQNVQEVIPEAVGEDPHGLLTLSERPILAAVVNAIKELYVNITNQNERVEALENEVESLRNEIESLREDDVQPETDQVEPETEDPAMDSIEPESEESESYPEADTPPASEPTETEL